METTSFSLALPADRITGSFLVEETVEYGRELFVELTDKPDYMTSGRARDLVRDAFTDKSRALSVGEGAPGLRQAISSGKLTWSP